MGYIASTSGVLKISLSIPILLNIFRYFSLILILGGKFNVEYFGVVLHVFT